MNVAVIEQLSKKETGADEQGNQLTAEGNHYCFSLHETLLQKGTYDGSWQSRKDPQAIFFLPSA